MALSYAHIASIMLSDTWSAFAGCEPFERDCMLCSSGTTTWSCQVLCCLYGWRTNSETPGSWSKKFHGVTGGEVEAPPMLFGQIRCFGVNATSPRAREPGSTCGDLIQAYLLVSSMAQAATLSMYPSSWISKIGMHANTFRIESFEFSQLASVTQLN